jgi:hypothetical protein
MMMSLSASSALTVTATAGNPGVPTVTLVGFSEIVSVRTMPPRTTGKLFGPAIVTVPATLLVESALPVPFVASYVVSVNV